MLVPTHGGIHFMIYGIFDFICSLICLRLPTQFMLWVIFSPALEFVKAWCCNFKYWRRRGHRNSVVDLFVSRLNIGQGPTYRARSNSWAVYPDPPKIKSKKRRESWASSYMITNNMFTRARDIHVCVYIYIYILNIQYVWRYKIWVMEFIYIYIYIYIYI